MKLICITGYSGSGKTMIAKFLQKELPNSKSLDMDKIVHSALKDEIVKKNVHKIFGDKVFKGKEIDRKLLGRIVFDDLELREKQYAISWEYTRKEIENELNTKHKFLIIDWFMISRYKYWYQADYRILVECNNQLRRARILNRDQITESYFIVRDKNKEDYSNLKFDFVVENNDEISSVEKQAKMISNAILNA